LQIAFSLTIDLHTAGPAATGSFAAQGRLGEVPTIRDGPGKSAPTGSPLNQVGWPRSGSGSRRALSTFEPAAQKPDRSLEECQCRPGQVGDRRAETADRINSETDVSQKAPEGPHCEQARVREVENAAAAIVE